MAINNIADLFVATLEQAGVKRIFGIVGDSLNGLTEALRNRGTIEWVHVRHEEVAAFAAAGEAQITGDLAVCAGVGAAVVPAGSLSITRAICAHPCDYGQSRPQSRYSCLAGFQHDFHGQTLYDLCEVTGRIVRRQQREL